MTNDNPEQPKGPPRPIGPPVAKAAPAERLDTQSTAAPEAMQQPDCESAVDSATADWSKPAADATGDAPDVDVPAGTLPSAYADWIAQTAQAGGTSETAILAVLVGTCGAAIGNARAATAGPGTWFLAVLWMMTVGTSGAAKSVAIRAVMGLYGKLERELRTVPGAAHDMTAKERSELAKEEAQHRRVMAAAGNIGSDDDPDDDLADSQTSARFIVHDGSVVGLENIVGGNPKGAIYVQQELPNLFNQSGKVIQMVLNAHDGEDYVRVVGGKEVSIRNFALWIIGGIQKRVLRKYFRTFEDNGLLARFLIIVIQRADRVPFHGEIDDTPIYDALAWLRSLEMVAGKFGPEARVVPFTAEAREAYFAGVARIEALARRETGLMESHLFKGVVVIGRLALVLAYMDAAVGTREEPDAIEADVVRRAVDLYLSVFVPMAREAFFEDWAPRDQRDARTIVEIIRRFDMTRVTIREIMRLGGDRFKTVTDVEHGFGVLIEQGVLRHDKGTSGPRGGRPSHGYLVNPHILRSAPEAGGD